MISNRHKVILHDLTAIVAAWALAFLSRFNFVLPPEVYIQAGLQALPLVVVVQALVARHFGLYKGLWRFASLPDLWNIIRAVGLGALIIGVGLFVISRLHGIPRSVLVLYPVYLTLLLGGPRLAYRLWKDHSLSLRNITGSERVIVIGAGSGGEKIIREMLQGGDYLPVGLVDDNPALTKSRIHGVSVLGTVAELPGLVERYDVALLIIAVPSATSAEMQHIVGWCEKTGRPFRTLPRARDIVAGRVGLEAMRDVAIEDLLSRDTIRFDWRAIHAELSRRSVLVTGGGGSIGSELCRQVAGLGVARLVVLDQSEYSLFQIERELRADFPQVELVFVLGDVCDRAFVDRVFSRYLPRVVFHAAAYKHVPILEQQVRAAVLNNIVGTHTVAEVAVARGCESFVLISTDKAVKPASVMGASKRFTELLCETKGRESATRFITVRFGNVLGSAGSVVPLFKRQIETGGPVTVTHPEATRYFMTIPEACQLILQAAAVGRGGEIFVLDMGEPVNITYLAEQLIRLSGRVPGRDIAVVYTGLRPGEKLAEELFHADEGLAPTGHEKLLLAQHTPRSAADIKTIYDALVAACERGDEDALRALLRDTAVGYRAPPASTSVVVPFERSSV
ncbi:MAG: nucleoside-diphosphate sugar epimerase/dehydratase [Gammaproteobacteria bacterium]